MSNPDRPAAVVTGANRGIGLEVARQLSERGYAVVLTARDLGAAERAARSLSPAGPVLPCRLDVTDAGSIAAAATLVERELGRADVLVNNAAIDYDTDQRAARADLDRVARDLDTNLMGAWRVTQAFLPLLTRSPHPRIVNVSSESGSISGLTSGTTPAYAVGKAGLNALTRLLAADLRADGMLVNAVCPGWTDTDMGQGGRLVEQGAASVVWGAVLGDDGPTGGFFRDGHPLPW
jgi:NAD(P)-dependent dehydrogenase (short-subunit alcohol dehydrogenase family)